MFVDRRSNRGHRSSIYPHRVGVLAKEGGGHLTSIRRFVRGITRVLMIINTAGSDRGLGALDRLGKQAPDNADNAIAGTLPSLGSRTQTAGARRCHPSAAIRLLANRSDRRCPPTKRIEGADRLYTPIASTCLLNRAGDISRPSGIRR